MKKLYKQRGGVSVNDNNGYLLSNLHNYTPTKVINSNHITTSGMAFPITANGITLYPNTGDFFIPGKRVVEKPLHLDLGNNYLNTNYTFKNGNQMNLGYDNGQFNIGAKFNFKNGGIHINPANKGKFNATKKATGKTTEELTHSSNPLTRKRAIFAQNAAKWHHQDGGQFQAGGQKGIYNLDGSFSPGYYDKKTDSWVSTGDTIPTKPTITNFNNIPNTNPTQIIPAVPGLQWQNTIPISGISPTPPTNPYANVMSSVTNTTLTNAPSAEMLFHGKQVESGDEFNNGLASTNPTKTYDVGNGSINPLTNTDGIPPTDPKKPKNKIRFPNISALDAIGALNYGLTAFSTMMEEGRQRKWMQQQMANGFNQTYSNTQNDYGVDPYEQTGQLRKMYQQGGRTPIIVNNPNDPHLKAYNDSLALYNDYVKTNSRKLNTLTEDVLSGALPIGRYNVTEQPFNGNFFSLNTLQNGNPNHYSYDTYKQKIDYKIKPESQIIYEINGLRYPVNKYKKPVQPIVYQKSQPKSNNKGTIITTNPNDPRLKSYNDSLNLYNKNYINAKNNDPLIDVNKVTPLLGNEEDLYIDKKTGIKPIGIYLSKDLDKYNAYWTAFKKPTQEVIYQKPQLKLIEQLEKIFPKPTPAQSRPAQITTPQQSVIPEPQGDYVYGPANSVIGFVNPKTAQFTPATSSWEHFNTLNKGDIDLLNDPNALKNYIQTKSLHFKKGGKFQRGGFKNWYEYAYADLDNEEENQKPEAPISQKKAVRITEDVVDQSDMTGFTPEDILNQTMNSGRYTNRKSSDNNFRSFATPEEGRAALENQLRLYQTGKTRNNVSPNSTLYQAMSTYAPASDNNNPKGYAEFIAKKLGISPNTPISNIDTKRWADAITQMEGNKKGNNPGNLRPYQQGGTYDLSEEQIQNLIKLGYKIKRI